LEFGVGGGAAKPAAAEGHDVASLVRSAVEKTAHAVGKTAHAVEKAAGPAGQLLKPVAGAVTSAFGWRRHPITHEVKFHQGVDLRAAYGQEVQSAAAGKVVFSGDQGAYGTTVVVQHQDGTKTRYAHLSARLVKQGDSVAAGEPLGRAGRSGRATGTHLHFEVIAPDGRRVQPDQWAGGRHDDARRVRLQADPAGPAKAGLHLRTDPADPAKTGLHRAAGNPPTMTVARSIKDRTGRAD